MQLHQLKRKTKQKKSRQIGRGGKRGTTAGRGTKGQKARAGHRMRPEIRDMIKKLPKKRGYRFPSISAKPVAVNLDVLDRNFAGGETVTPAILLEKGLIHRGKGKLPVVKILGRGALTKAVNIKGCLVSATAQAAISAVGGKVE